MFLSVIAHLFYSSGYLLDYYIHTETYRTHCVNQDRPELHCDGKCILAQKIRAAQKEQGPDREKATIPMSMEYLVGVFFMNFLVSQQNHPVCFCWKNAVIHRFADCIFIPPEVSGS